MHIISFAFLLCDKKTLYDMWGGTRASLFNAERVLCCVPLFASVSTFIHTFTRLEWMPTRMQTEQIRVQHCWK